MDQLSHHGNAAVPEFLLSFFFQFLSLPVQIFLFFIFQFLGLFVPFSSAFHFYLLSCVHVLFLHTPLRFSLEHVPKLRFLVANFTCCYQLPLPFPSCLFCVLKVKTENKNWDLRVFDFYFTVFSF